MSRSINGVGAASCIIAAMAGAPVWSSTAATTIQVAGTGTDLQNDAIVHSKKATPDGEIDESTEIVELRGQLNGKVLYHVTTVIDRKKGTLVNTGDQVFSGTIAGSAPVMLHDGAFHFEVNLSTGTDTGSVHLTDHIAGPRVRCELSVNGTGNDASGNPTFAYVGTCTFDEGIS